MKTERVGSVAWQLAEILFWLQVQIHGLAEVPLPVTAVDEPAEHKLEVGADMNDPPFELPQAPPGKVAEHEAFPPELLQDHRHGLTPVPLPTIAVDEPTEQRLEVGAELKIPPFALPQMPAWPYKAEQEALAPPLNPAQDQLHGLALVPLPETVPAVPTSHKFEVGFDGNVPPSEEPHEPSCGPHAAWHDGKSP
jgi:hypothetical protein